MEPCFVVYEIESPQLDGAVTAVRRLLSIANEPALTQKCLRKREERIRIWDKSVTDTVRPSFYSCVLHLTFVCQTDAILAVAQSEKTHWKYSIIAIRCLRTLIRRDVVAKPAHIKFLVEATLDSHYSIVRPFTSLRALKNLS